MRTLLLALAVLLAPAAAGAESIEFEVKPKVYAGGKERPTITIHTVEDCDDVVVKLRRADGKALRFRTGRIPAGTVRKFALELPAGREMRFTGSIERRKGGSIESLDLDFAAELIVPPTLRVDPAKVDLAAHRLELTSTRKVSKVEVEVTGDRGEDLGKTEVPFDAAVPGTPLKVEWKQAEGTVMRISLRVWDTDRFYQGLELFPWHVSIPHEEVNFASGSSRVEAAEEPKLASSLEQIQDAVERYGRFADLKLFVVGHTDTVGGADANRALSLQRARAICEYFRKHGLRVPIFFDGYGEDALKLATPDETDEVANRRAEYIVAIVPPPIAGARAASWKALR